MSIVLSPDATFLLAVVIAVIGGAFSAFVGWAESGEPFNPRKMFVGVVRGGFAGVVLSGVAIIFEPGVALGVRDFVLIFFGAAGIDVLGAEASRIIGKTETAQPTPTS